MRIKKGFVIQKVSGSYLACATGKLAADFSAIVKLNETGAFLWNKIEASGEVDKAALCDAVAEHYGIDREIAERDVAAFVENLSANGILE